MVPWSGSLPMEIHLGSGSAMRAASCAMTSRRVGDMGVVRGSFTDADDACVYRPELTRAECNLRDHAVARAAGSQRAHDVSFQGERPWAAAAHSARAARSRKSVRET